MMDTYVNRLVLALRMREVPGNRIGEVVAEVEAHVAETHETPAEAFGSADEYADHVATALNRSATERHRRVLSGMLIAWPIASGAMLLADGVGGLAGAQPIELTLGKVLLFGLLPPVAVLLVRLIGRSERPSWPAVLAVVLLFAGVFSVPLLLSRPVLATYPAWPALTAGALLLAGALPWAFRPDLVIDPRDGRNRYPVPRWLILIMAGGLALPLLILLLAALFLRPAG